MFSKVGPGQPENLSFLAKARFGLLWGGKQSSKCEVLFEFRGLLFSLHWTNHSSKPCRSRGWARGGGLYQAWQNDEAALGLSFSPDQVCSGADGQEERGGDAGAQERDAGVPSLLQLLNSPDPQHSLTARQAWPQKLLGPIMVRGWDMDGNLCVAVLCVVWNLLRGGTWRKGQKCLGLFLVCTQGCHLFI